jgi:hemoglobin/transferrin/lactoferrin receptor protein
MKAYAYHKKGGLAVLAAGLALGAIAEEETNTTAAVESNVAEETVQVIPQEMDEVRTVSVIDDRFIQDIQASTLGDIFRVDPEISVGGGGIPTAQKIYVRGLEDTMLNVQINGAPQTAQIYHHQARVMVDPEMLKTVTVESGAGAATYGPGALGGSIQFEYKNASDLLLPGQSLGAYGKAGYYSNGGGYKASAGVFGSVHKSLNLLALYSHYDIDDYEAGGGVVVPDTATTVDSLYLAADGRFGDDHSYDLNYEVYRDAGDRRIRPNFVGDITHPVLPNPVVDQEVLRQTATFGYNFNPIDNDAVNLELKLYTTDTESTQVSDGPYVTGPPFSYNMDFNYDLGGQNYGLDLRNTSEFNLGGRHATTYGVDYRYDKVNFENRSTGGNGLAPALWFSNWPSAEESDQVYGVFLQDNWRLHPMFLLSYGVRWDQYDYKDRDDVEVDMNGFSPNIGATFSPIKQLDIYANAARAIRGMTVGEALWVGDARKTTDPNADPEVAYNYEIGLNGRAGGFEFNLEGYYEEIQGYIGYLDRTNLDDVKIPGYSGSIGYHWDMLVASIGVNESFPEMNGETLVNEDNIGLGAASGRTWITRLEYLFPTKGVTLGWNGRFVEELTDLPPGQPNKAGFGVQDIYVSWNPPSHDALTLTFTVMNVFDKFYYEHNSYGYNTGLGAISGLPEPGRDFRLSASYKF